MNDAANRSTPSAAAPSAAGRFAAVERLLERWSEWLNPILVKESRQALKSRQFSVTFILVLLFAWGWTFLGLARIGPDAAYASAGPMLFTGYFVILAFALIVLVPFGAFRSLAAEQEERTYELLSITTLRPVQIISGKLGSAAVQMLIHLSAVSPCLAFTYLLRGIDFPTIAYAIVLLMGASLGLSVLGLAVAALSDNKYLQVLYSVIFIGGAFLAFIGVAMLMAELGPGEMRSLPVDEKGFWIANAILGTIYGTTFVLVFLAAAALISFAGSNRSTRLRVCMVVQTLALVFWVAVGLCEESFPTEFLEVMFTLALVYWFAMGALMTGESTELSLRVRRNLPQSLLGRAMFTWFNPGPGTGYMLAVCAAITCLLLVTVGVIVAPFLPGAGRWGSTVWRSTHWSQPILYAAVGASYLTIYLGVGLLLIRLLRRYARVHVPLAALLQALLLLIGSGGPTLVQALTPSLYSRDYSLLQVTNVFWTLDVLMGPAGASNPTAVAVVWVLPVAALGVLCLNLPGIVREVRYVRIAKPQRVEEEDRQLHPPPPPKPESPWDA